jgi:hypothetical protein
MASVLIVCGSHDEFLALSRRGEIPADARHVMEERQIRGMRLPLVFVGSWNRCKPDLIDACLRYQADYMMRLRPPRAATEA